MESFPSRLSQTPVTVRQVRWVRGSGRCDRCSRPAAQVWDTSRTAIDIDLDTDAAIDGALKAWALQTREACTTRPAPASRSRRGRPAARRFGPETVRVAA